MTVKIFCTAALVLVSAISTAAQALELDTGLWEITMSSNNPMTGQPVNEVSKECITDGNFDPVDQMAGDASCKVTDRQEKDGTVTWKMNCGGAGMPDFRSEGRFTSHGNKADGEMKMTMSMGGQIMEMRNTWQGRQVSAKCK